MNDLEWENLYKKLHKEWESEGKSGYFKIDMIAKNHDMNPNEIFLRVKSLVVTNLAVWKNANETHFTFLSDSF